MILRRLAGAIVPLLLAAAMLAWSVHLGPDASWDLRNYHLYDAFAALRKHGFHDLVPAQLQTFLPPMADLPSLWLRFRLNRHPGLLDALLAIPSAVAVLLAWGIGRQVVPERSTPALISLTLAILFGATGAAGLPTTGTAMSEMPAACLVLAGLLLMLRSLVPGAAASMLLLAGMALGAGAALKLTLGSLVLAALIAEALSAAPGAGRRLRRLILLALGIGIGLLLIGGPWWWHMARLTGGNPIFPYMNGLFRSPLLPPVGLDDERFLPRTPMQTLAYPFFWSLSPSRLASELAVRDPRLALAFVALLSCPLVAVLRTTIQPADRRVPFLLVFLAAGYVIWEAVFGVLRYLAPIELLCGLVLLVALRPLGRLWRWAPPAILAALLAGCAALTIYPDWGRASPTGNAATVVLPTLPPNAMVLLLTPDPMAYVAAFASPAIRFVGVNNNIVRPGQDSLLEHRVEQAVHDQQGPIFGLEVPASSAQAEVALRFYRLHRALPCRPVVSSLEQDGLRLCRLLP